MVSRERIARWKRGCTNSGDKKMRCAHPEARKTPHAENPIEYWLSPSAGFSCAWMRFAFPYYIHIQRCAMWWWSSFGFVSNRKSFAHDFYVACECHLFRPDWVFECGLYVALCCCCCLPESAHDVAAGLIHATVQILPHYGSSAQVPTTTTATTHMNWCIAHVCNWNNARWRATR